MSKLRPMLGPDASAMLSDTVSELCTVHGSYAVLAAVALYMRDWASDPLMPAAPAQQELVVTLATVIEALVPRARVALEEQP